MGILGQLLVSWGAHLQPPLPYPLTCPLHQVSIAPGTQSTIKEVQRAQLDRDIRCTIE